MSAIELQLFQVLAPILVGYLVHMGVAFLQKNKRTENLATVAQAAGDAVNAVVASMGPNATPNQIKAAAFAAAKATLIKDAPQIQAGVEASVDTLLHGNIHQLVVTPGGSTVELPSPTLGAA
jgi:hypothetical protein